MFETRQVQGWIEKVRYDSKVDSHERLHGEDAILEITIKIPLQNEILTEVERRYFPGLHQRAELTGDKVREFADKHKIRPEEQSLWIWDHTKEDKLVEVKDALPHADLICKCRDGWAELFFRVKFRTSDSLELLKKLDQRGIAFTMQQTQMELDSALTEALRFDQQSSAETGNISNVSFKHEDREVVLSKNRSINPTHKAPESARVIEKEVPLPEPQEDDLPDLPHTASEKPITLSQVDYRLSTVSADKAKAEFADMTEEKAFELGQTSAIVAYERQVASGKNGYVVRITLSDIKKAKAQLGTG